MVQDPSHQALLLFRVGPILCGADTTPVMAIIEPRPLTRPPGSTAAAPGIFKHAGKLVKTRDLRQLFGTDPGVAAKAQRVIITEHSTGQIGFIVDEIIEVMAMPASGFGPLPSMIPKQVFQRTLLRQQIYLVTDFSVLAMLNGSGYLRPYLEYLQKTTRVAATPAPVSNTDNHMDTASRQPIPVNTKASVSAFTAAPSSTSVSPAVKPVIPQQAPRLPVLAKSGSRSTAATSIAAPFTSHSVSPATTPKSTAVQPQITPAHQPNAAVKPAATTPQPSPRIKAPSLWPGILLIVLFLSGMTGMVWWLVTPAASPHPIATQIPVITAQTWGGAGKTTDHPATPAITVKPVPVTVSDTSSNPNPVPAHYAASIARDKEGITIELEAPTDEPVFTSTAKPATTISPALNQSSQLTSAMAPQTEIIHTVVKGDTLWHIAKRYVNDPYRYPELARLSHIADPDLIYPGNRVRIIKKRRK